jgi:hypothetical protein
MWHCYVLGSPSHHLLNCCEDWVLMTVCHHLIQGLAFSELHHFSWDIFPISTMAYGKDQLMLPQ